MTAIILILNLFCLLSILISSGAHGANVQAFRYRNFTGLIWEGNSTDDCNNMPYNEGYRVYSIRTDTCFIAYTFQHCNPWRSKKYMPGDIVTSYGRDLRDIKSFQVCNEEEGGSQLNLDITEYYQYHSLVPDLLESYMNVCSCVNVPPYVQNFEKWSINNHHNALLAYYEPDCAENKWNFRFIEAGHNGHSRNVHAFKETDSVTKKTYNIQSFGPDPNSTYFQTSCNASHVTTTEIWKTFTTENQMSSNAEFIKQFEVLTNQILKLQLNQSDILKEQTASITKLTQTVSELKQGFLDFSTKIKSDLHDIFA